MKRMSALWRQTTTTSACSKCEYILYLNTHTHYIGSKVRNAHLRRMPPEEISTSIPSGRECVWAYKHVCSVVSVVHRVGEDLKVKGNFHESMCVYVWKHGPPAQGFMGKHTCRGLCIYILHSCAWVQLGILRKKCIGCIEIYNINQHCLKSTLYSSY